MIHRDSKYSPGSNHPLVYCSHLVGYFSMTPKTAGRFPVRKFTAESIKFLERRGKNGMAKRN
jgi:hypothetical protein